MGDAGRSSRQISCLKKGGCHEKKNTQNNQCINDHDDDHAFYVAGIRG